MSNYNSDSKKLLEYSKIYEMLISIFVKDKVDATTVNDFIIKIESLAWFAWYFHPGRYADARLECAIKLISNFLKENNLKKSQLRLDSFSSGCCHVSDKSRKVLHIASEVYSVGGHTRLLYNLIIQDSNSCHSLIITRQNQEWTPKWLLDAIQESGGCIYWLPQNESPVDKMYHIQEIIELYYDFIFLHIHPDDAVTLVAIALNKIIPIIFINHADHVFCLGTSLVDTVACIRKWSAEFTLKHRLAKRVDILPIPLEFKSLVNYSKDEARDILNIGKEQLLFISVASHIKFIPNETHSYFEFVDSIVSKYPFVIVKVVGVSPEQAEAVGYVPNDRVSLVGRIENPLIYYKAADFFIDSMPFSSFTSLWEGIYFECFPILQYNPVEKFALSDEPAIQGLIRHAADAYGLLCDVDKAIDDINYRTKIVNILSHQVKNNYTGNGWLGYLNNIYLSISHMDNKMCHNNDVEKIVFSKDDIDSANLPNQYNSNKNYLVDFLYSKLYVINIFEIIRAFPIILKFNNNNLLKSIRNILGMIKVKINVVLDKG